jgi:DNA-binding NarL/FixJ family response regulator
MLREVCGMAIKLVIADDHRLILQALRRALGALDEIEIVGEAQKGSQVVPLVRQTNPDLVLLDIRMPELDGLACIDRIRSAAPTVGVVVLSATTSPEHVEAARSRGARAYVAKSVDPLELPTILRNAAANVPFSVVGIDDGAAVGAAAELTDRETDLLKALARGLSNRLIGKEFWITEQTVKFHLTNIYRKLGVVNRTEAVRYAYTHGIAQTYAREPLGGELLTA